MAGVALEPGLGLQRATGLVVDRWFCSGTIERGARLGWGEGFEVIQQHWLPYRVQAGDLVLQCPEEVGAQVNDPLRVLHRGDAVVGRLQGILGQLTVARPLDGKPYDLGILPDLQQLVLEIRRSI